MGGAAKGLLDIGGVRIVDRVVSSLHSSGVIDDIVLSSNEVLAPQWLHDVRVLADKMTGGGLAGVHAALSLGRDVLVVAWDMPFVPHEFLHFLAATAGRNSATIVAPTNGPRKAVEPFCTWYSAGLLEPLADFLREGGGPAHRFIAATPGAVLLTPAECRPFGDPRVMFMSVNTPQALARARALAELGR
jgi:molybdopterin-guanine dinucleotide biosynthesis protein A